MRCNTIAVFTFYVAMSMKSPQVRLERNLLFVREIRLPTLIAETSESWLCSWLDSALSESEPQSWIILSSMFTVRTDINHDVEIVLPLSLLVVRTHVCIIVSTRGIPNGTMYTNNTSYWKSIASLNSCPAQLFISSEQIKLRRPRTVHSAQTHGHVVREKPKRYNFRHAVNPQQLNIF